MSERALLCWILIICCSCVKPYSNCTSAKDPVIPLIINQGDTLNLYLDSMMVLGISTPIDYHEKENRLYVYDNYNNRLLQYPLNNKPIIHPDSIHAVSNKNKVTYFRYLSTDSLLLYTYQGAELLYYNIDSNLIYKRLTLINKVAATHAAPPY